MNSKEVIQKEYLKKYLRSDLNQVKKKKEKRKKIKTDSKVTIVDDDIDFSQLAHATAEDLDSYNLNEDLPQIAGIIDERPAELIAKEDYKASGKWKTIGNEEEASRTLGKHYSVNLSSNETACEMENSKSCSFRKRLSRSPDASPPRRRNQSLDASPPRKSRKLSILPTHEKKSKTLDGKKAGLQDARSLREENEQFRKNEEEMYRKMKAKQRHEDDNLGVRDRKFGRNRHFEQDIVKDRDALKKQEERKESYTRWGKGLKQIENYIERVETENHEMSKPISRYANDKDLEEYLRNQCREGDPMASYFRKKSSESKHVPCKPTFQGSFPENRFNIRPGYRWDGVDRSNGYEKKCFDALSQRKAIEEEAYKYSVEDM